MSLIAVSGRIMKTNLRVNKMKKLLRIIILLLLVAGIAAAIFYRDQLDPSSLEHWVKEAGSAGPIVFMLLYIVGTIFFFPGAALTLAGGALFGPVYGTFYNLTAATIGAMISFLAARYLAHDWVEKKAGGRVKQLKEGVEGEGWKFVAFVRLVPLFPFNVLNYALGLTNIKFSHYSIASYLFMLPGTIAYTYLGYAGREAVAGGDGLIQKILLAVTLLAIVGFLPGLISRMRRGPMVDVKILKQKMDEKEELLLLDVRSANEYIGEQGHIDGSVLIPLEELELRLSEIEYFQEKPVMIICRTDRNSGKAAQVLLKNAFTNVHVVKNGMQAWIKKSFPVKN